MRPSAVLLMLRALTYCLVAVMFSSCANQTDTPRRASYTIIPKEKDLNTQHLSMRIALYGHDLRDVLARLKSQSIEIPEFSSRKDRIPLNCKLLICDEEYRKGLGHPDMQSCFRDPRVVEYVVPDGIAGKRWTEVSTSLIVIQAKSQGKVVCAINSNGDRIESR
jgi:hypothetical protein